MPEESEAYTQVARALFNEFLEMVGSMKDAGDPRQHAAQVKTYLKEINKWKEANDELKQSAQRLVKQVDDLELELSRLVDENTSLRARLNEALIHTGLTERVRRASREYPFKEHLSDAARKEWHEIEKMMREIPSPREGAD